jgi:hypothetical protein
VILVGSVETFNELFERSKFFGLGIKILEANHLFVVNSLGIIELGIDEMDACRIRRVSVGNQGNFLIGRSRPDGFVHSDNGGLCTPVVGQMIRSDFQVLGRDKEKDVMVLTQDLDVRLITCRDVIDLAFVLDIESMTVPGGTGGIIENGLMRDLDTEDITHDLSGLPSRNGKRNIEGQNQAKDILAVMDSCQLDWRFIWRRVFQFLWLVVILPVLVVDFEL